MNYLKILKTISWCMILIGFFLTMGSVGTSDYMDAVGEYHPYTEMLPTALIGIALSIGGVLMFNKLENDWVDEEDWED